MRSWMMLAGLALAGVAGATQREPANVSRRDLVAQATADANVPVMADAYQRTSDPVTRVLAAMALERIHFNLDKSSEDARLCEQALIDSQPGTALFCAQYTNGNLRLAKGAAEATDAERDIIRRFTGKVPAQALQKMQQYVDQHRDVPAMTVDIPASGASVPLVHILRDDRGALEVEANGQTTRLVMDTGAGPLVLGEETARRMGVRVLPIAGLTRGLLSKNVPVRFGILDRMRFGPITVSNAPVEIVAGRKRLVGLDILRQLGAFRISRDTLQIYGEETPRPACREPLLVSGDTWGNSVRVVVALPINGSLQNTLIDSGSAFYLSGNQQVQNELATTYNRRLRIGDMGPLTHHARVSQATAEVVVSGQPIRMTFGVFTDANLRWPYILGSGALRDMDFFFDFQQRHTCLLLHDHLR